MAHIQIYIYIVTCTVYTDKIAVQLASVGLAQARLNYDVKGIL